MYRVCYGLGRLFFVSINKQIDLCVNFCIPSARTTSVHDFSTEDKAQKSTLDSSCVAGMMFLKLIHKLDLTKTPTRTKRCEIAASVAENLYLWKPISRLRLAKQQFSGLSVRKTTTICGDWSIAALAVSTNRIRIYIISTKCKVRYHTWYIAPKIPKAEENKHTPLYASVLNSSIIVTAISVPFAWWQQKVCIVGSAIVSVLRRLKSAGHRRFPSSSADQTTERRPRSRYRITWAFDILETRFVYTFSRSGGVFIFRYR